MSLTAWKHRERNRHRDRKMCLLKLQGVAWFQLILVPIAYNSLNDSK